MKVNLAKCMFAGLLAMCSLSVSAGTPSINIGSDWFVKNIRKTQTIDSLQANKEFVDFVGNGPNRPEAFEAFRRAQARESKN